MAAKLVRGGPHGPGSLTSLILNALWCRMDVMKSEMLERLDQWDQAGPEPEVRTQDVVKIALECSLSWLKKLPCRISWCTQAGSHYRCGLECVES